MNLTDNQMKLLNVIKQWLKIEASRKLELHEKQKISNLVNDFESTGIDFPWDDIEKELGLNV